MSPDEIMRASTIAMLISLSAVSFALFLLIISFKGKHLTDWLLGFRDLLIGLVAVRIAVVMITGEPSNFAFRLAHWTALTLVCIALFITLVREHIVYQNKILDTER